MIVVTSFYIATPPPYIPWGTFTITIIKHHRYSLSLGSNHFSGTVPASLRAIDKLRVIDLRNNAFDGLVRHSLFERYYLHIGHGLVISLKCVHFPLIILSTILNLELLPLSPQLPSLPWATIDAECLVGPGNNLTCPTPVTANWNQAVKLCGAVCEGA